ncbi:hypothetical protein H5410_053637, partial [Solanum commersonii]
MARENDRFSFQLFADPKTDCTIKAPKELVDEEHPLLFKPYDILGYFEFFGTEAGREAGPNVLKAYCGDSMQKNIPNLLKWTGKMKRKEYYPKTCKNWARNESIDKSIRH